MEQVDCGIFYLSENYEYKNVFVIFKILRHDFGGMRDERSPTVLPGKKATALAQRRRMKLRPSCAGSNITKSTAK